MHAISKQQDQQQYRVRAFFSRFLRFRLDFFPSLGLFLFSRLPPLLQARAASHAMHMLLHVRVKGSGHASFLHRSSLGSP